ncbi:MAG TPA: hypothetical protein VK437_13435 [Steroidobacteraceae bacterium]|nr:hypothetical protein [Steroidobacteraceae bacterium]
MEMPDLLNRLRQIQTEILALDVSVRLADLDDNELDRISELFKLNLLYSVKATHPEEFDKTMSEWISRHPYRTLPSPLDIARVVARRSDSRMVKDALSAYQAYMHRPVAENEGV